MNKTLKIINLIVTICIVFTILFSLIISQDEHHLEVCHEEHCIHCAIIHIAQNIISITIAFIVVFMVSFLIYFFLSRLYKKEIVFVQVSLVFQKVQFNE